MSSSAISAQGTKLYIGSTATGALTVTGITKAFNAEVTATNSLAKGDRVTFASVGGMTEINSLSGVVMDTATGSFVCNIDSRAFTTYTTGGTATPVDWTQIKEIKSFDFGSGERSDIDVTNLDSTAKEYRLGLKDNGTFNANISIVHSDSGQTACRTAHGSSDASPFKVVLPDAAETGTFDGLVKSMPESGAVDGVHEGSIAIRITGDITWT